MIQSRFFSHVREGAIMIVMIESRLGPFGRQAEFVRDHFVKHGVTSVGGSGIGLFSYAVAGDEDVQPAIVVVVPEPGRKTLAWFGDFGFGGEVGKVNAGLAIGRTATVIMQKNVV